MNYTKRETKRSECGCLIGRDRYSILTITYCSKHKAAPDMYEALHKVRANIGHIIMTKADAVLVDQIDSALAKAEGK